MSWLTAERYPPDMGYYDYTPLHSPYEMSWPALHCNTCGDPEMSWAYPVREVDFPRQITADGDVQTIHHAAQPWFACSRCWPLVEAGDWARLATELGKPQGYFAALAAAKSHAPAYRWTASDERRTHSERR
ncbi:hypothetical protein OG369_42975 [Streptomyces sp. NBC_01221]|uniref:hypothetical protein n=1 Tax=Streptomyces sp. NBC_01221 TaxID=2903782 RepID=UPI00225A5454|nr:hypothetical protein [Streptomyces sp. NBC_01221]MCX4792542.1 hypothetical protein [Streptomyces sp. NBC_01221]